MDNKTVFIIVAAVLIILAGFVYYYIYQNQEEVVPGTGPTIRCPSFEGVPLEIQEAYDQRMDQIFGMEIPTQDALDRLLPPDCEYFGPVVGDGGPAKEVSGGISRVTCVNPNGPGTELPQEYKDNIAELTRAEVVTEAMLMELLPAGCIYE